MKKMKIWSMLMLVAMMLSLCSSCSKDKEDGLDSQPGNTDSSASQEDIYYVKYEVQYYHQQMVEHNVTVNTENGSQTISLGNVRSRSWEGTYGPFKKGFTASVSLNGSVIRSELRINVSKNNEMFVLKEDKVTNNGYPPGTITYTIN